MPPDAIVEYLYDYMKDKVIGSVNVYIQEYDENMKSIKFDGQYISISAGDLNKERYAEYAAKQRRERMKVVASG